MRNLTVLRRSDGAPAPPLMPRGPGRVDTKRTALLRLIDANSNRALEGLRVCEDIVRFQHEATGAFRQIRNLRHAIAQTVRRLPVEPADLLTARQSRRDVGHRAPASPVESLERLLVMNFQRVKESLRTLEEAARLLDIRQAPLFQTLRFRTYDTERTVLIRLATVRHR